MLLKTKKRHRRGGGGRLVESYPPGAYTMRRSRWPPGLRLCPTMLTLF